MSLKYLQGRKQAPRIRSPMDRFLSPLEIISLGKIGSHVARTKELANVAFSVNTSRKQREEEDAWS